MTLKIEDCESSSSFGSTSFNRSNIGHTWLISNSCSVELLNIICFFSYCYVIVLMIIYTSWSPHSRQQTTTKRSLYNGHNRRYCCLMILLLGHFVEFGDYVMSRHLRWYYILTPISGICANVITQIFYNRLEYRDNHHFVVVLIIFWFACGLVRALQFLSLINSSINGDYLRFWTAIATSFLCYVLAINDFGTVLRENNRKKRQSDDDEELKRTDDEDVGGVYRYHESGWYSRITFYWILPVLWRSYTAPLESEFFGKLPNCETSACQYKLLLNVYNKLKDVKTTNSVSLWKCYFYCYWKLFLFGGLLKTLGDMLGLMPSLGISVIVKYVEHVQGNPEAVNASDTNVQLGYNTPKDFYNNGFVMALIILIASLAQGSLSQGSTHIINVQGIRLKNALQTMIYSKLLRTRRTILEKEEGGANTVTKMMSEDVNNIMSCFWIGHYVWAIPLKIAVIICLLYREMGISAVFGSLCCIIIMISLQYIIGKKMSRNSKLTSDWNDRRMRKMNEVLQGIKLMKLCCWENIFCDQISGLRNNELNCLNVDSLYWAILTFLTNASSIVLAVLTLTFHSCLQHVSPLETSTLFTSLALFNQLTVPLFIFPIMVPLIISALVSTKRLEHFMNLPEHRKIISGKKQFRFNKGNSVTKGNKDVADDDHLSPPVVSQSFRLRKITEKSENEEEKDIARDTVDSGIADSGRSKNINPSSEELLRVHKAICSWHDDPLKSSLVIDHLVINKGTLNVVIGDVGSGKSALMKSLIGEMVLFSGRIIWSRNTRITYVSQNPWLLNTTIKDNILFGTPYREKQFKQIISACALQQDIDNMTDKEQSVVGEKGVTLSGGQKHRIAIARALYSNADVVFTDDPLSSVDSKVAEHIFENAIRKYVSKKKKTVVFSTNSKKLLLYANQIIFMKDCHVKATGNLSEVCKAASEEVCKWGMLSSFSSSSSGQSSGINSFQGLENAKLTRLKSRSYRQISNNRNQQLWSPENSAPFIFTPLKRRLSTFSGSRYFAHDLPLPTDDCDVEVFNQDAIELHKRKRFRAATVTEGSNSSHKTVFRASSLQINRNSYVGNTIGLSKSTNENGRKDNIELKNAKRHNSASSAYSEHEESITTKLLEDDVDDSDVWDGKNSSTAKEIYSINCKTYFTYIKACNVVFVLLFFLSTFAWQILRVIADLWLSVMTSAADMSEISRHALVYGCLAFAVILLSLISTGIGQYVAAKARKILHERMLHNTLQCSVSFFENMPLGRIINVFSNDVDVIDKKLATSVQRLVQFQLLCLSSIFVNLIITPWFIVFVIPISLLYYLVQKFYRKSSKYLYQLDNSLKSPIVSQISETVAGLETIRVFGQEERFMKMIFHKLDLHTNVFLTLNSTHRWLGITLDYLGGLIVFVATLVALISITIYPNITTPALIGLAINYTLLVPIYLNWVVKFLADLEAYMIAVERIRTCIRMPTENYNLRAEIPRNWPNKGTVNFENVTLHYNLKTKPVIQNLNIEIPGGQKVGICGRTGSGKSSLVLSLFKIVSKTEGVIKFDNVDIETVPLHVLRSCISIIPQDTIMFSGTIRDNMDLKREYSDKEIWRSLKQVHIADTIAQLGGLESTVQEGGLNLSVGQRQMISLARAVLYESACLILDEATSSLQLEFEKEFLHLARVAFSKKTVIVITHRISSLLDFDRILVLNNGALIEDGSPTELISNPSSTFSSMLKLMDEY